jgi:hypothetical protein
MYRANTQQRGLVARLMVAVAAMLALLAASAPLGTHYFCRMMGQVITECCCERSGEVPDPNEGAQVRAADCCERLAPSLHSFVAVPGDHAAPLPPAPMLAVLLPPAIVLPAVRLVSVPMPSARAPPLLTLRRFIAQCRLLI